MLKGVIYEILHNRSSTELDAIRALLAAYEGGYAIFNRIVPKKAKNPMIVLNETGEEEEFGTRSRKGGKHAVDLFIFEDKTLSVSVIDDLANKIWNYMSRCNLSPEIETVLGYKSIMCKAETPTSTFDDEDFLGVLIRLQITFVENT